MQIGKHSIYVWTDMLISPSYIFSKDPLKRELLEVSIATTDESIFAPKNTADGLRSRMISIAAVPIFLFYIQMALIATMSVGAIALQSMVFAQILLIAIYYNGSLALHILVFRVGSAALDLRKFKALATSEKAAFKISSKAYIKWYDPLVAIIGLAAFSILLPIPGP